MAGRALRERVSAMMVNARERLVALRRGGGYTAVDLHDEEVVTGYGSADFAPRRLRQPLVTGLDGDGEDDVVVRGADVARRSSLRMPPVRDERGQILLNVGEEEEEEKEAEGQDAGYGGYPSNTSSLDQVNAELASTTLLADELARLVWDLGAAAEKNPRETTIHDISLLQQMARDALDLQKTLQALLGSYSGGNETIFNEALVSNDALQHVLKGYDDLIIKVVTARETAQSQGNAGGGGGGGDLISLSPSTNELNGGQSGTAPATMTEADILGLLDDVSVPNANAQEGPVPKIAPPPLPPSTAPRAAAPLPDLMSMDSMEPLQPVQPVQPGFVVMGSPIEHNPEHKS